MEKKRFYTTNFGYPREVKEIKSITGNIKFYAVYEKYGEVSHSLGGGGSQPPALVSHNCQYSSNYLVYCNSWGFESNIDVYELRTNGYRKTANIPNLLVTAYSGDLSAGRWSRTDVNPTSPIGSIPFTYYEDNEAHTFEGQYTITANLLHITGQVGGQYFYWDYFECSGGVFVKNVGLSSDLLWIGLAS